MKKQLQKIINYFGPFNQVEKLQEELKELSDIVDEWKTGLYAYDTDILKIKEELADVLIMIEQLKMILKIDNDSIKIMKQYKINRTLKRIQEGYYDKH